MERRRDQPAAPPANNNNNNEENHPPAPPPVAAAAASNEHVEFTVRSSEDLFLEGTEKTIPRVRAETNYSCLMLKTQRFSSLFRHYAKYHGLKKDELEYFFVSFLGPEDTPEAVQLQRSDVITVRKKQKKVEELKVDAADDDDFRKDMRELMEDEEHMDCVFVLETGERLRAHKSILTARGDYFKGLFRKGCFSESDEGKITVPTEFSARTIGLMLEFIYTNRINELPNCDAMELLEMMNLSNVWLLRDLKKACEYQAMKMISIENVAKMLVATDQYNADRLKKTCIKYITENIKEVTSDPSFLEDLKEHPQLCIPILRNAAELIPEQPAAKKRKIFDAQSHSVEMEDR